MEPGSWTELAGAVVTLAALLYTWRQQAKADARVQLMEEREQAARVYAVIEPQPEVQHRPGSDAVVRFPIVLTVANDSTLPICDVETDWLDDRPEHAIVSSDNAIVPWSNHRSLMPGRHTVTINVAIDKSLVRTMREWRPAVTISFRDAAGRGWMRDADQRLDRLGGW
ncbi:MAG: hypothetical protein ACOYBY_02735 [Dermatophilaceae bacterium]